MVCFWLALEGFALTLAVVSLNSRTRRCFHPIPSHPGKMGSKQIAQETFDDAVQENITEFEMDPEEAVREAVQQFESQGIVRAAAFAARVVPG